ncbi:MAG: SEL1-like repeat protein, partial [Alistipes sp.]|nr:SEL1-like repeat protein [Alistipes sp.]
CYTLEAPKPINGSFYISSDPIMADIFVDGKKMGQTPLMLDLVVGKHKLILQKEGYVTIEKEIEIVEGKSLELSFNLNRAVDHFTPGKASYDAKNYTEAIAHFTRGAEQGDAKSECWLGVCLYHGYGTNVDYAQAANYFTRSAEKGYAEAQFQLANCYLTGNGVKRNTATAAKLLQKAALQNHKQAQRRLAACYETGVGVPRNTMMAMTWYKIASGQIQLPKQQQQ